MRAGEHRSSLYNKKAVPRALWDRPLQRARDRIYERFIAHFPPAPELRIVDIGVNGDHTEARRHFLESRYPFRHQIVAAGLEPPERFRRCYPDIRYVQLKRGEPLPFRDGEFDIAFCNAVLEHVGPREVQRRFLSDVLRVGQAAFVTTPNRWYPVELHTMLPLAHFLPAPVYRRIYRALGFDFFAREDNLNLLDRRSLAALVPETRAIEIETVRFLGFESNLLLIAGAPGSRAR